MSGSNRIYVLGAIVFAAFIALYVIFFASRGTLKVSLSPNSEIKSHVQFWLSNDSYKKPQKVPASIRLRAGRYTIQATGTDSAIFKQTFRINSGEETSIVLKLVRNPQDNLIGTSDSHKVKYYSLFPYNGGNYQITASLNDGQTEIARLSITIYHQITPDDTNLYAQEKDQTTTAAKKWLSDNNIPSSIPIDVIDQ